MARISRKQVEARFELAMKLLGLPTGECWTRVDGKNVANVGVLFLDYAPGYGGYEIRKIANEGGAESSPFGYANRRKATEFMAFLDGIVQAAHLMKNKL